MMATGKVYLVGAGPGDAGLLTLKGYRLLCRADVILYDYLIPAELLLFAEPGAELICVGKSAGCHSLPQSQINELLIDRANAGKLVVRLKGGDPYLFGRGGEEAQACAEAKIDFEVVPGISSAIAAGCYAGIPATHRDYASSVAIVTGHRKDKTTLEIPRADTVIFLMGVSNIAKIIGLLLDAGWSAETKIAGVEHGTCYNQRIITGTLSDFVEKTGKAGLRPPAVFIVGSVVELGETLNWFAKKSNVLVLGSHPEKYEHLGNIVHRQIIDCVPLDDYSKADAVIAGIGRFDWLIFTSVNGVKFFFERLHKAGKDTRKLAKIRFAAIGQTTAEKLGEFGILADIVPQTESSAGLLGEFKKLDMQQHQVLIPCSQIASDELPNGLTSMGAVVEKLTVYKTIEIEPAEIDFDYIDKLLFTSGSTVRAFINRYGQVPAGIEVYCLGLPSLREAQKYGIRAEVLK
jgi:uroporphyrinogen III methyltransferase/synthase